MKYLRFFIYLRNISLILFYIFFCKTFALAQDDSLQVYFYGESNKGEKFKVYHGNNILLKFKSNRLYKYSFKIPKDNNWKNGSRLNLVVKRKGQFCLFYKDTGLNTFFVSGKKYYIIYRDPRFKNRYAVNYEWSDYPPSITH